MPRENVTLQSFNRGKISTKGLARTDLTRTKLSAERQRNYIPRVLGAMSLRPGFEFIGSTYNNQVGIHIPFVKSLASDDIALIELTPNVMRVRLMDNNFAEIVRGSVSTTITNGTFNTDLTGWTNADQTGATSDWKTGGYMRLVGTRYSRAIRKQTLTISTGDQAVRHAIRIIITNGTVNFKLGSSDGTDNLITTTDLGPGIHSLAFMPVGGSAYLEVASNTEYETLIDSITIAAAGD